LFLWFQKPITHSIWNFYVKVMLEEVREGWLSWRVEVETLKAHNYLMRRFLFLIFRVYMSWNVNFSTRYYSFNLELAWQSYELGSEVVRSCLCFERKKALTGYKSQTIFYFWMKLIFFRYLFYLSKKLSFSYFGVNMTKLWAWEWSG